MRKGRIGNRRNSARITDDLVLCSVGGEPQTVAQIAEATHVSVSRTREALRRLVRDGEVHVSPPEQGLPRFYNRAWARPNPNT
jgi:DNA-binding GntR family transcriptional regulator